MTLEHLKLKLELYFGAVFLELYLLLDWYGTESGVTRVRTPTILVVDTVLQV